MYNTGADTQLVVPLRLVGGAAAYEGRVEVFYSEIWGTVCDDLWNLASATVVCRQLGYVGVMEFFGRPATTYFGEGSGTIWLDNLECTGEEKNIAECFHNGWGIGNCGHSEDASLRCIRECTLCF